MKHFLIASALTLLPLSAVAQGFTYTVDLTPDSPHFGRNGSSDTNYPYVAIPVTVTDGLNFGMVATGGTHVDAYMYVYSSFDPLNSADNIVLLDDDGGAGFLPAIGPDYGDPAIDNGNYVIVVTSFSSGSYGTLIFDVFGITFLLDDGPSIEDLARDLKLQYSRAITSSAAARNRSLAASVRQTPAPVQVLSTSGAAPLAPETLAAPQPRFWASTGYTRLNEDVEGTISRLQVGADRALPSGQTAGVALSFERVATSTDGTDAKGRSLTIQPYLSTSFSSVDAVFSLAFGRTEYDEYTFGGTTGSASARNFEISAHFETDLDLGKGATLTPYAQLALGRAIIDFGDALGGVGSQEFSYRQAGLGAELSQTIAMPGLADGSRAFGRLAVNHASSTAPTTSFALVNSERGVNTGEIALGLDLNLLNGASVKIEAQAMGLGNGQPDYGLSGGLTLNF